MPDHGGAGPRSLSEEWKGTALHEDKALLGAEPQAMLEVSQTPSITQTGS